MKLKPKKDRKPFRNRRKTPRANCAFCSKLMPEPEEQFEVFTASGCMGGRCVCGAAYAFDEIGRSGGVALLDALALLCDGDLDRAQKLSVDVDYEVESRLIFGPAGRRTSKPAQGDFSPKIWSVRFKDD